MYFNTICYLTLLTFLIMHVIGDVFSERNSLTTFTHSQWENPYLHPYFDNSTTREVIGAVGQTVNLICKVRNLGDRSVSWIRKRDLSILTIGILGYTNDQRYQVIHPDGSDEWILQIQFAQRRDTGDYECQISTEPKMSLSYRLSVLVAKAKIQSNRELYFKSGSDINLTCIALDGPKPPAYIYWYKDGSLINYLQRGGINVITERLTRTSTIVISKALPADSGNYTCSPSYSNTDSVMVHVIKSENRAAMQHENSGTNSILRTSKQIKNLQFLRICGALFILLLYEGSVGKRIELMINTFIEITSFSIWR